MCTTVTIWSTVSHTCTTGFQVMALEFAFLNDGRTMDPSPAHCSSHPHRTCPACVRFCETLNCTGCQNLSEIDFEQESKELHLMRDLLQNEVINLKLAHVHTCVNVKNSLPGNQCKGSFLNNYKLSPQLKFHIRFDRTSSNILFHRLLACVWATQVCYWSKKIMLLKALL